MSLEAIRALDIAPLDLPAIDIVRNRSVTGGASALVDAGSVIAFVAGISAQDQEDVLFSTQLAQRAADGVADADGGDDLDTWYAEYNRVLLLTGWRAAGFAPSRQKVTEGEFEMAKAALQIIAAAATGPQSAVLTAAIQALSGMAKDDGFITLFEHFGAKNDVRNFQLGAVEKGAAGELSMGLGAFRMKMTDRNDKFLFVKWRGHDVEVWADARTATFNRAHYAPLREQVKSKLGKDAASAIAALPL